MRQYGGQQLTTGAQAEVYADHFIANHLKAIGGGKTYAQLSAEAIAQPKNTVLAAQVATVFKGDLSGPCAPSPLAVPALKAARLMRNPAIGQPCGNAAITTAGPRQLSDVIRSPLCIYCRTDKFVYWPPASRLSSADCPGCQRRIIQPARNSGAQS